MKFRCRSLWKIVASCSLACSAQTAGQQKILDEFIDFLKIPNVARDIERPFIGKNADWIVAAFAKRGLPAQLLKVDKAPPVVFAEWKAPGATRTLMFYAHYDGQPVDPSRWTVTEPFTPKLVGDRLYARSASDDKAPIIAMLAAIDAMKAAGRSPKANIKFFFEGEEEAGSRYVADILRKYKPMLEADVWLFCDGPVHQSRRQQIVFGARGSVGLEVTVYGPNRELHSGHYGNWAPNPAQMLVSLAASMRNDDGLVLIEDFEKGMEPLSKSELAAIAEAPDIAEELAASLSLGRVLGNGERIELLVNRPILNLRGISSAAVGRASRNVVPSTATASFDIRLVKGIPVAAALERVKRHIESRGYHVVGKDPDAATLRAHPKVAKLTSDGGYNAVRASMDLPISAKIIATVEKARGPVLKIPTMGGSLPMAAFEEIMQRPLIIVPIANHDNNQHSHDENLRLQNLWDGIVTMRALLEMD
ncbi:MAG: M20/M25/M40 family metallo-hydrolase [Acidobacteria bacterium]|nr:M20/M25/M40 family metallo-hydrolase [Acidobacteriota bacterium]